jgi:hypothetical protein
MVIEELEIVELVEDAVAPDQPKAKGVGFEYVSFEEEDRLIAAGLADGLLQPASD